MAERRELAVAVVLARERHPVGPPGQQAAAGHQLRCVPGPRMRIARQLRGALYHLLRRIAFLALERPPLRPLPWLHIYPQ